MLRGSLRHRILLVSALVCVLSLVAFGMVTIRSISRLNAESKKLAAAVSAVDFTIRSVEGDLAEARNILGLESVRHTADSIPDASAAQHGAYGNYYGAVDRLLSGFDESMIKKGRSYLIENQECLGIYKKYSLSPVQSGDGVLLLSSGRLYYKLAVKSYSDGGIAFYAESSDGATSAKLSGAKDLASFIDAGIGKIRSHYAALDPVVKKLDRYSEDRQVLSYLNFFYLHIKKKADDYTSTGFDVHRSDGSILCKVELDLLSGALSMGGVRCKDAEEIRTKLLKIDTLFDVRTASEKKADAKFTELSDLVKDREFTAYLEGKGCKIAQVPADDDDFYIFDITNSGGVKVGSISLEKATGEVYIFDNDGVLVSSVKKN